MMKVKMLAQIRHRNHLYTHETGSNILNYVTAYGCGRDFVWPPARRG
jgi:hypothetical protein